MADKYYEELFDGWVRNFALNLNNIWNEPSARILELTSSSKSNIIPSIVIGRGPSLKQQKHLEILADSKFDGAIVCTDGVLITALESGVTPEKFSKFHVVTIDAHPKIRKFYDHEIVKKYGQKINGVFSNVTDPTTVECARENGIKIHWVHSLFDYHEGKKSFNNISALMVRAKKHEKGLPAIQTGGNAGTASWFVSWKILKSKIVTLIGLDHSWNENDPWEKIISHGYTHTPYNNSDKSTIEKLFPKKFNPEFQCNYILDPIFQYYSQAFKEFCKKASPYVRTINATEGGAIYGEGIKCMKFRDFLERHNEVKQ